MSTRCQIGFYETNNDNLMKPDALLYRHSDGYPGTINGKYYGVLMELVPFLKLFQKRRGLDDVEYASAWTLHHLIQNSVVRNKKFGRQYAHDCFYPKDGITCFGYGVCDNFHGDIEWYYAVQGATLRVYKIKYNKGKIDKNSFTLNKTVKLGKGPQ